MKRNELKSRNGITLIALIITIIILLILAMVTINILINQGIIGHANNAVRGYEVAEEKEQISLAYQNYKMDQLNNKDATFDMTQEDATVVPDEEVHGWYITFNKTKHNYTLTEDGTVETSGARWVKNGDDITLGDVTVKVGDYIGYDHTKDANGNAVAIQSYTSYSEENTSTDKNDGRTSGYTSDQTFNVNSYTNGWRVLGVKGGKLQLISAYEIKPNDGGLNGQYALRGQQGYRYAEEELNSISAIYGQGKGVEQTRSIKIEDIDSITGYNPNRTGDGKPYHDGMIDQYGNNVTYYWVGGGMPYYTSGNNVSGSLRATHSRFFWYEDEEWKESINSNTASNTDTGREKITTIKNTFYEYYPYSLTTDSSTTSEKKGITTDSIEYKLLFGKKYWISSRCIQCTAEDNVKYCVRGILNNSYVTAGAISSSTNYTPGIPFGGVRPVITLSSDVQIKSDANHDGTSAAKAFILQ